MTKTSITLALSLLTMGCGKKSNDAVCEDACSDLTKGVERCMPGTVYTEEECNATCGAVPRGLVLPGELE